MKTLKLKWKRVVNPQERYEAKAAYESIGAQNIGGSKVAYRAMAVNRLERAKGTSPWRVTIEAAGKENQYFGKTFTEVKGLAFEEIKGLLEAKEKAAAEREALIAEIKGIYKQHGRKPNGNFDLYPDSELKKHLEALKKGKFPWKMPPRESPAEESPAAGVVVRIPVPESIRDQVLRQVKAALERRVQQKGDGAFVSIHELRGALDEEHDGLAEAMHSKDLGRIEAELLEKVVGGVFGLACIRAGVLK